MVFGWYLGCISSFLHRVFGESVHFSFDFYHFVSLVVFLLSLARMMDGDIELARLLQEFN